MGDFSHFNEKGRAKMVEVGQKEETKRVAIAFGKVIVNSETFSLIESGGMKKGDVLGTAQIAGIMAAKETSRLIPMCHPIMITGVNIDFEMNKKELSVEITCEVKCKGVTGVEMEALSGVSVAALTIYDMCKAVQKDMIISDIGLVKKTGGKSGNYFRGEKNEI